MRSFLLIEWPNSKFSLTYDRMICIRPTVKFLLLICTYESTIQNAKRPKLCLEVVWEALEIRTKSKKCHWAQRRALFKKYSSLGKHTSLHRLSMRIVRIAPRHKITKEFFFYNFYKNASFSLYTYIFLDTSFYYMRSRWSRSVASFRDLLMSTIFCYLHELV